ncbi:MAG: LUD domain-containing protein [Pseudomonadota bacterium]
MTEFSQAEFFGNIQKALNRRASAAPCLRDIITTSPDADDIRLLETIRNRDAEQRRILLERITAVGNSLNITVRAEKNPAEIAAAIAAIAADSRAEWGERKTIIAWDHPLVNALALPAALEALNMPVYFPDGASGPHGRTAFRAHAENALIGVTAADYCIAESATLALKVRTGQPRCASLLPSIHIAVVRLDQILTDLKEFYALLKWDPKERSEGLTDCLTLITGPSKTADIEATLVQGAHGPRALYLFVLTAQINNGKTGTLR